MVSPDSLLYAERVKTKVWHREVLRVGGGHYKAMAESRGGDQSIRERESNTLADVLMDQATGTVGNGLINCKARQRIQQCHCPLPLVCMHTSQYLCSTDYRDAEVTLLSPLSQ